MELAALKESLRRMAPAPVLPQGDRGATEKLSTSHAPLDRVLAGGIPKGAITEVAGDTSSGKTALSLSIAAARTQKSELVAYLDARGELYPPTAAALGIELCRMLLVSFKKSANLEIDIARAAEILLRTRHFPLLIIDLPRLSALSPKRSARLRRSAHDTGSAIITLSNRPSTVTGASVRMQVWPHRSPNRCAHRRLEVHIGKGARNHSDRAVIDFSSHRIDHAPAKPLAPVLRRAAPGAPLKGAMS